MSLFKKGEITGGHQIKPRSPAPHQGRVLGQAFGRVSAMFHVKHGQVELSERELRLFPPSGR